MRPGSGALKLPPPRFTHLAALTDSIGLFEHALYAAPRLEHGYCAEDVARGLAVAAREPEQAGEPERLALVYLRFLEEARLPDGRFRNRRSSDGHWTDSGGSDDAAGRVLYGLGVAAANLRAEPAQRALTCFEAGAAAFSSVSPRANAWAMIGAAEVGPGSAAAAGLFGRAADRLGVLSKAPGWPWPEERLAYDNARIAEARIAGGLAFGVPHLVEEGLDLLRWLVEIELRDGHFSFVPVGGLGPGDARPGFDQQPVEAGDMAEACVRALEATGDPRWAELGILAAQWFAGANDTGTPLLDADTGGCCDGLQHDGRNENQGAESTLAAISALQAARRLTGQAAARSARSSSSVETHAAPTQRSAAPYVM